MKKIVEKSLEAALIKASTELSCSVADLEYEIVQNPSSGFLGLGKKEAIIIVESKHKDSPKPINEKYVKQEVQERFKPAQAPKRDYGNSTAYVADKESLYKEDIGSQQLWGEQAQWDLPSQDDDANAQEICKEIKELFALLPFEIDRFEVRMEENNTLFVYIDGRDCALLIGERGYRYKALSYLLFNWINPKYGYSLRLEIAEFFKNQEEMIDIYLKEIVHSVKINGKAQTKILDGILVYIALNKLREIFPDKYVSVRQNDANEKYVIVNDFRR
ncbi:Jag N-terminal domain-containing protein [Helicobacter sp. MIT 21-1697]|uniref:Jag N-terminal domain-containing protein n=1 Tax=Helicobacter sp. MIT 21-1697 TaxID=2993733 RepID=UPI00224AD93D|nr:Jag N-terminal domain-containing protein [Helicobacter sp. MIT 21-1697]MCX2717590.1 Jag N-terminal domain-containing protein [Helicobacter sp. MIT 21-1697]